MVLPSAPNSISFAEIRNEFYNANAYGNPSAYGTVNANLYNVNFYRGKAYWNTAGYYQYFTTGTLDFNTFRGKRANCACDCVCDCGDCP